MSSSSAKPAEASSVRFKRRFMTRLIAVVIGGMFLDGYILGILGPVTGLIREDLAVDDIWIGLIAAGPLFGIFIGSPLAGWATDKFGRKPMFLLDMALFVVASAMQFFIVTGGPVPAAVQLFIIRVLMGVAIGGEYAIGWPLTSEFSPPKLRGRLLGVTVAAWYVGFMVAFIVGTAMRDSGASWRVILGSSTVIAVALFLARLGLPESPSWLISKGRRDEALAVARRYIGSRELNDSITTEIDLRMVKEAQARESRTAAPSASVKDLFSPRYWRVTLFTAGFWFWAVSPYFALATFADEVLAPYGINSGGVGMSALAAAGVVVTVLLVDKVGRRVLTVPPQWLCAVLLLVIGVWTGAPVVVVMGLFFAFSFFNAGYNTLTSIYPAELFPSELRGIGTGFAAAVSRIGAALATFALPWSMTNLGESTTLIIAAVVAFAGAALSQWLAPETKGKTLAETAAGFSH